MSKDPLDNHLVGVPHKHFAWIPPLTIRQRQASYWWVNKRLERGQPIGCWGIYRWLSDDGFRRGQKLGVEKVKSLAAKRLGFNNLNISVTIVERCGNLKKYNSYRNWCYRNFHISFVKWNSLNKQERTKLIRINPEKIKANRSKKKSTRDNKIDYVKLNIEKFQALNLLKTK